MEQLPSTLKVEVLISLCATAELAKSKKDIKTRMFFILKNTYKVKKSDSFNQEKE